MKDLLIDKFLNKFYDFGKYFSAFAVIVLCLIILISVFLLFQFKTEKINYPDFSIVRQSIEAYESNSNQEDFQTSQGIAKKIIVEKTYKKEIENIVASAKLKPFAYDMITSNVIKYDKKYQKQYIEGLNQFLKDATEYLNAKPNVDMSDNTFAKYMLQNLFREYNLMFDAEIERIYNEKDKQFQDKMTTGATFAISLLLLFICLLLSLLIKIEKNTRLLIELKKEKENV